jgi:hypothetical protein
MPIQQSIDRVASIMHTLATAEVVDNTFGMVYTINQELQNILREVPASNASAALGPETVDRLREVVANVENNRLLFGIPEQWLINNVLTCARNILQRLER